MYSAGKRSDRVERICPSLMNVGPRSLSSIRNRRATDWRRLSGSGSTDSLLPTWRHSPERSSMSANPCRAAMTPIWRRRLRSWNACRIKPGLKITQVPHDKSLEDMLVEGEIDALLSPDLIRPLTCGDKRVGRLFPNYKEEEIAFYGRTGIFPIMHVVAIKQEIVERH